MSRRSNTAVLRQFLRLDGSRVLDVGSGDGALVRYMTRKGAVATGLECGEAQLAKARSTEPEGEEVYVEGFGQNMPFEDNGFDAVIFFNSLHHIPVESMDAALSEARRMVTDGGIIYVAEPVAEGPSFELHAPVDDETEVQVYALAAVNRALSKGLIEVDVVYYDTAHYYDSYEDMREECIRIDPARAAIFDDLDDVMRARFSTLGVLEEKGYRFDQPMRVNVLRKPARE